MKIIRNIFYSLAKEEKTTVRLLIFFTNTFHHFCQRHRFTRIQLADRNSDILPDSPLLDKGSKIHSNRLGVIAIDLPNALFQFLIINFYIQHNLLLLETLSCHHGN